MVFGTRFHFFFWFNFWIFHPTAITFQRTRMQPIASKLEERFLESLAMAILAHNFRYSQKQWECKWFSTIPTTSCLSAIQGMCKLSIYQHFKQFITQKQFRLKLGSIVEKGWFCYLACPKYSTNARNDRRKGNPNDEKRWEQSTRAWFSAHLKQKKKIKGSYLLNASRGNVVVLRALVDALKSGHLAGAAIDVYPVEPESNINVCKQKKNTRERVEAIIELKKKKK